MARSAFRSQNVQNTPGSEHFWKLRCLKCTPLWREAHVQLKMYKAHQVWRLRCGKRVRRCGAKHMSKSKCSKHTRFGPLLEVEMSKKVHAIVARSAFRSQKAKNTTCSDHFLTFRCRFAWQAPGIVHLIKSEQNVRILWHFQKRWQAWGI